MHVRLFPLLHLAAVSPNRRQMAKTLITKVWVWGRGSKEVVQKPRAPGTPESKGQGLEKQRETSGREDPMKQGLWREVVIFVQGTQAGQGDLSEKEPEEMAQTHCYLALQRPAKILRWPKSVIIQKTQEPWRWLRRERPPRAERLETGREQVWRADRGCPSRGPSHTVGAGIRAPPEPTEMFESWGEKALTWKYKKKTAKQNLMHI